MIIRACTWGASIQTPEDPANYSQIVVLLSQSQEVLIRKETNDLTLSENGVHVDLTQEETKLFKPSVGSPRGTHLGPQAFIQIRAYKSNTDAPGSACWAVDVQDSLSDEILTGEEP